MLNVNEEVNYAIQQLESVKNDDNKGAIDTAVAFIDALYNRYTILAIAYSDVCKKLKNTDEYAFLKGEE